MPFTRYEIEGGYPLQGEVKLSGAKNAVLPAIAAACLGDKPTILSNVPIKLHDIRILIEILQSLGAKIDIQDSTLSCSRGSFPSGSVALELAKKIRYSLLLLGMAAAVGEELFLPLPGGCAIGNRKHDLHILGLRSLGHEIIEGEGGIRIKPGKGKGTAINLYLPTTSGTENIMLAAVLAEGATEIRNANTRPEVMELGRLLVAMGAEVDVRNRVVKIIGVNHLKGGASFTIMPGWDEAVTFLAVAGVTKGEIVIPGFDLRYVKSDIHHLRETGIEIFEWGGSVYATAKNSLKPFDLFTGPYPAINSDMQPIFAVLALMASGESTITDMRFTERFGYTDELRQFGANLDVYGNCAVIKGNSQLNGAANVKATDLRGGAAVVLCALAAQGKSSISNIYQIERGYEQFDLKLRNLGAKITRLESSNE